jgi:hypothetical protein
MATFGNSMTIGSAFKSRAQLMVALGAIIGTAAATILAASVVISLAGSAAPGAVDQAPFAHDLLRQHLLRENGLAPAFAPYPDAGLRNHVAAPVFESYPDAGLRNHVAAPVFESYPDAGLRNPAAAPVFESYPDTGLRNPAAAPEQ